MPGPSFEPLVELVDHFCAEAGGGERASVAARVANRLLVLRLCEARGLEPYGRLLAVAGVTDLETALARLLDAARARYGGLFAADPEAATVAAEPLRQLITRLYSDPVDTQIGAVPIEALGQIYERGLAAAPGRAARKARGVYYTPRAIADQLVADTVLPVAAGRGVEALAELRLVDPACGSGMFLLAGFAALVALHVEAWQREPAARRRGRLRRLADGTWDLTPVERRRILQRSIFGVDRDRHALELARLSLILEATGPGGTAAPAQLELAPRFEPLELGDNLRWADSVVGPDFDDPDRRVAGLDWPEAFPAAADGGFDVVLGNPPWGQKQIVAGEAEKRYLGGRFPSSRGIFDWFRPFVELGVSLVRPGGSFGMVLPDIVLLKNYQETRRFLLDQLALTRIEHLGMAFPGATIDAVTVAGRRRSADSEHRVAVVVRGRDAALEHDLRQADFERNPRCAFNLLLTEDKRRVIDQLADHPRLGDWFEAHEGVHSGNIRDQLFVAERVDDSCQELFFGRDELRRHSLSWAGRYLRLSAVPRPLTPRGRRSRQPSSPVSSTGPKRYANVGRPEWHRRDKLLVRRTGDAVSAAVDRAGRYASNNFFLVLPRDGGSSGLDGLSALLNSSFMTWYFRAVEPRRGRAFAELKIKHLVDFPLPAAPDSAAWAALEALGRERGAAADPARATALDTEIDAAVLEMFAIAPELAVAAGLDDA